MRKRRLKPMRLTRWADGILPAVLLAGSIFKAEAAATVFVGWLLIRVFGLFSANGVRMAYAVQPSMRDVNGSTTMALLIHLAGAAGMAALLDLRTAEPLAIAGMGLLLNIEHLFYEYLHAAGERYSAVICRILTGAFLLFWMFTDTGIWIGLGLMGLAAFIANLIALAIGGYRFGRLNLGIFKAMPRAIVQGVLYPAAAIGAQRFLGYEVNLTAFFAGLMLFELCRTPFRRSRLEARTMNILLIAAIILSGAGVFACLYFNFAPWMPYPLSIGAAALCALILWGRLFSRKEPC